MSTNHSRKLKRAGAGKAEHNARRLFHLALSKMETMEASFYATLNSLPLHRRISMAARLIAARLVPSCPQQQQQEQRKEGSQ